jgi:formylglycine-generating enzyme required for sulfatase activity
MRNPHVNPPTPVTPSHFKEPSAPVESVSWGDVAQFLRRLNIRDTSHHYRLPTEAEWEYACGAGNSQPKENLADVAWFSANSDSKTSTVGSKLPNAWGLHDMLGNVSEWVNDWYDHDYYGASPAADPQGPETGSYRVFRGGCWFDDAANCRPAYRAFDFPINKFYNVGFRVVRTAVA